MSYSDNSQHHPFLKRGSEMRTSLMEFLADDWMPWDRIFTMTRRLDYSDETTRRAIREGCDYGVFRKRGGRTGGGGEAQVGLTPLGMLWLAEQEAERVGVVLSDDEVEFCEHEGIVGLCDICDSVENLGGSVENDRGANDGD